MTTDEHGKDLEKKLQAIKEESEGLITVYKEGLDIANETIAKLAAKLAIAEEGLEKILENKCIGCGLYIGDICNGEKSYEHNGKKHHEICMEHRNNKLFKIDSLATTTLQRIADREV